MVDHVRISRDIHCFKEGWNTDTVDTFTNTLMLEGVVSEELHDFFSEIFQCFEIFVCFKFDERLDHRAHQVTNFKRTFTTDHDGCAAIVTRAKCLGHNVDTVHTTNTGFVVDFHCIIVVQRDGACWAHGNNCVDCVLTTFFSDVCFNHVLLDDDVITPSTDHVIGTWRDDIIIKQDMVKAHIAEKGRKYTIDTVVSMCPTRAISLNDDDTMEIDNKSCVRCMHCINVMTKALSPGNDRGASIMIGGKRSLKVGDLMGTMIKPFIKLETDEDFEALEDFAEEVMEFFADNALEHERIGECIDRIGVPAFLEAMDIPADPNMVNHPRTSSYVRMDDFDEQAAEYFERKAADAGMTVAEDD